MNSAWKLTDRKCQYRSVKPMLFSNKFRCQLVHRRSVLLAVMHWLLHLLSVPDNGRQEQTQNRTRSVIPVEGDSQVFPAGACVHQAQTRKHQRPPNQRSRRCSFPTTTATHSRATNATSTTTAQMLQHNTAFLATSNLLRCVKTAPPSPTTHVRAATPPFATTASPAAPTVASLHALYIVYPTIPAIQIPPDYEAILHTQLQDDSRSSNDYSVITSDTLVGYAYDTIAQSSIPRTSEAAEMTTLIAACTYILRSPPGRRYYIESDCTAAIQHATAATAKTHPHASDSPIFQLAANTFYKTTLHASITISHVYGHNCHQLNELADAIARHAANHPNDSHFLSGIYEDAMNLSESIQPHQQWDYIRHLDPDQLRLDGLHYRPHNTLSTHNTPTPPQRTITTTAQTTLPAHFPPAQTRMPT